MIGAQAELKVRFGAFWMAGGRSQAAQFVKKFQEGNFATMQQFWAPCPRLQGAICIS